MQITPRISNQKIIITIVFICSAIIASLFVYHLRNQSSPITLSDNAGIVFPLARDIKSFKLITTDNQPFAENNFNHHWTLLFFGFTQCKNVCPATLEMLKKAYPTLHATHADLQIVFISLDPERDTKEKLATYTQAFHNDFLSVSGKIEELRKLQSQLGIFSERDNSAANYQIQHSSSILLINPQGKWAGLFKYGLNAQQFSQAFEESLSLLG